MGAASAGHSSAQFSDFKWLLLLLELLLSLAGCKCKQAPPDWFAWPVRALVSGRVCFCINLHRFILLSLLLLMSS